MPVPWEATQDSGRPFADDTYYPVAIPNVSHRSMTLRQLYQFRDYLKRLCKVGILKEESSKKRIFWFDLNQYHINELVIKRIIPKNKSCSWAELVSGGPQMPDTFISHYWGESFRDFMLSIEHHSIYLRVGLDHTYWFCVCANNQWKLDEELGSSLETSPFYNALEKAQDTLLMLDRDGLVTQRAWCLFEWHRTIMIHRKDLCVATCMGLVGSALVSSGPYTDLLKGLNSAGAKASDPSDLRRIQNAIAGCNELEGLEMIVRIKSVDKYRITTESSHCFENGDIVIFQPGVGSPLFTKGMPLNDGDELYVKVVNQNELELFEKEACTDALEFEGGQQTNLIKADYYKNHMDWLETHKFAFNALDSQVNDSALTQQTRSYFNSKHTQGNMTSPKFRAVTLAQLRKFAQDVKRRFLEEKWNSETLERKRALYDGEKKNIVPGDSALSRIKTGGLLSWEELTWYHIKYFVIMKDTAERSCSYVETITNKPRRGQYHFTFPWDMTLSEFMAGIEWLAEARQMPDTAPLLIYPLNFNLRTDEYYDGNVWKDNMDACESAVYAGNTLRVGPLLDLQNSISCRKSVDFMCRTGVKAFVRPFAAGSWEFGQFDVDTAHSFVNCDVSTHMETLHPKMRQRFLKLGYDIHVSLTRMIRAAGAGPILREAAYLGDRVMLESVFEKCQRPWFNMNGPRLRGPLGETALHVAAGAGNIEIMEILLKHKSDVNAIDLDGETPLHYAAFAGQTKSVEVLLENNAEPGLFSYFSETPLEVASQQPAFFSVKYDGVIDMLRTKLFWTA